MNNPIIDNRIVNDITFAVRLKSFLKTVNVYDQPSEEELSYLLKVAGKLISYQMDTATDEKELQYFSRIKDLI